MASFAGKPGTGGAAPWFDSGTQKNSGRNIPAVAISACMVGSEDRLLLLLEKRFHFGIGRLLLQILQEIRDRLNRIRQRDGVDIPRCIKDIDGIVDMISRSLNDYRAIYGPVSIEQAAEIDIITVRIGQRLIPRSRRCFGRGTDIDCMIRQNSCRSQRFHAAGIVLYRESAFKINGILHQPQSDLLHI